MHKKSTYEQLEQKISELEKEIDRLKGIESDFRKNEERYEKAEEICNYGHWDRDFSEDKALWSKNTFRIFGVDHDEFYPSWQNLLSLVHPDDRELIKESCSKALLESKPMDFIYRIIRPDQSERFIHSVSEPAFDDQGKCIRLFGIVQDITEQKKAGEALRESEEKYRTLVEAAPEVFYTISREDGSITSLNPAFERITGWPCAEWLGKSFLEIVHPDDRTLAVDTFDKCCKGEIQFSYQLRILSKSGEYLIGEFTSTPHVKDNRVVGELGIARDITEKKLNEEALQKSEKLFSTIFHSNPVAIAITDAKDNRFFDVNHAWEKKTGISREEAIGYTNSELNLWVDPEDRYRFTRKLSENGNLRDVEVWLRYKSGNHICMLLSGEFIDISGKQYLLTIAQDITKSKKMEEELRAASLYTRNLIEASLDPLVTINADGKIMDVNKATEEVTGVDRNTLIGSDFCNYFTEPEKAKEVYKQVYFNKAVKDYPLRIRHISGRITDVLYNASVYKNEAGDVQGVFATARDITERKRIEKALHDNEEKYRLIFENSLDGILFTATDGTILSANPSACRILERTEQEICQAGRSGIIDPTDPFLKEALEERTRLGRFKGEVIGIRKDGTKFPVEISNAVFKDSNDNLRTVLILRDITKRKQAEDRLARSETLHKEAQRVAHIGHWELDPEIGTPVWSEEIFHIFGLNPEEGEPSFIEHETYVHPEDWPILDKAVRKAGIDGTPFNLVFRIVKPGGDLGWMNAVGTAIKDQQGNVTKLFGTAQDITESRRVEEALQNTEKQFKTVFHSSPIAIAITRTKDNHLIEINKMWEQKTGISREEAIGHTTFEHGIWPNPEVRRQFIRNLREKCELQDVEAQISPRSGKLIHMLMSGQLINFGGEECLLTMAQDLSEIKRMEEELRAASLYTRNLIEASLDPLVTIDTEGKIMDVNKATEDVTGVSRKELIGSDFSDYFTQPERAREGYKKVFSKGTVKDYPLSIRHSSGSITDVLYNASVYKNEKGEVQGVFAAARDITERKKNEEALRESEERFRKVFEEGPIGMVLTNRDRKFFSVNPAFCKMLGYTAEELIGKSFLDVTHPEHRKADKENVEKMWRQNISHYKTEKQYIAKDGSVRWSNLSSTLIRGGDKKPLYALAMIEDITDRKNTEIERERLQSELFQSQKMESLGRLVSGIAHEINNPVNIITNNAPLMQSIWKDLQPVMEIHHRENPNEKYGGLTYQFLENNLNRLISDMELSANRIASVVQGLKDFSRKTDSSEKKLININTAVENALRLTSSTIRETGVNVEVDMQEGLPEITANLQNLEQIIMNLLMNALQAIEHAKGLIKIETTYKGDAGVVVLSVKDNGMGIEPEIYDKIFDPFFTQKREKGGAGLGLAITTNLVKENYGDISFSSRKAKGTTFFVSFPVKPKIEPTKILLVDDDEGILKVMKAVLSRNRSYIVDQARDGNEALIKIGDLHPDLLILDIFMPGMDGIETMRAIKKQPKLKKMKIIIVTGYPKSDKLRIIKNFGDFKIIEKPFNSQEFLKEIEKALEEREAKSSFA